MPTDGTIIIALYRSREEVKGSETSENIGYLRRGELADRGFGGGTAGTIIVVVLPLLSDPVRDVFAVGRQVVLQSDGETVRVRFMWGRRARKRSREICSCVARGCGSGMKELVCRVSMGMHVVSGGIPSGKRPVGFKGGCMGGVLCVLCLLIRCCSLWIAD